jgi:hypothetical protein
LAKDAQYWREIRCNKLAWNNEQIVDICHNVTLVVYIQFMIILIELKQVLCQEWEWLLKELTEGVLTVEPMGRML